MKTRKRSLRLNGLVVAAKSETEFGSHRPVRSINEVSRTSTLALANARVNASVEV
jgi:hypothetical protein